MGRQFLKFEQPIADLQAKINELRLVVDDTELNLSEEIARLEKRSLEMTRSIFGKLSDWQVVQLARHPLRPHSLDYITRIFTDFDELHGDRCCSSAPAIVGGIARLNGDPVVVMGHEKGRSTRERLYRNFGMAEPEAYRKALRLMKLAEKFKLPIITFIDTSGAYPGIEAEERNQSRAIARNLFEMSTLKTPIICIIIGEGGSGGALAIGVGDRMIMLEYSVYSVISPEGCASILWKRADKASEAAHIMGLTANKLLDLGLIDEVIPEPLGGAHRDYDLISQRIKESIENSLKTLQHYSLEALMDKRYQRLMAYGK